MGTQRSLLEEVPAVLREPFANYERMLPAILPQYLADADLDTAIGYIAGALDHQERVSQEDSKVFKGVIERVEPVTRKTGEFVLGKKMNIVFRGASQKGRDEEQEILTGWVEFNGYDAHTVAFEVALATTMVAIAEVNIGRECLLRKAFMDAETSSGGSRVRYLADLKPIKHSSRSDSPSKGGEQGSGHHQGEYAESDVRQLVKRYGIEFQEPLSRDDYADIADIFTETKMVKEALIKELAGTFRISASKLSTEFDAASSENLALVALEALAELL